ncbi:uncharacterized protein LOC106073894 isoform X1 [Biomphalaria glabrata]|uniref:Uncharacterized protein LOC106073894 isoform X1 n=1 Tax=Biomphalaria glabrata TaxID=6526 RepID=A0A9U8EJE6_BIOGL|nr:uncharacterized protein LOC106073894 isoform X1 [Biomphalaria glabrata]KAI8779809.1 hypothetical protein BgiBS90_019003 [Biomphalaria glabrata]
MQKLRDFVNSLVGLFKHQTREPASPERVTGGYEEISEEFLEENRQKQNFKKDLNEKLSTGQHSPTLTCPAEASAHESDSAPKPNGVSKRNHPYDEIEIGESNLNKDVSKSKTDVSKKHLTQSLDPGAVLSEHSEDVKSEPKKVKEKKKEKVKAEGKKKKDKNSKVVSVEVPQTVVIEDTETEYSNIEAIKAHDALLEKEDLYAKPIKSKTKVPKEEPSKPLNYIEVVITPKSGMLEVKPVSPEPITYSNVIKSEDGKIVLVPES